MLQSSDNPVELAFNFCFTEASCYVPRSAWSVSTVLQLLTCLPEPTGVCQSLLPGCPLLTWFGLGSGPTEHHEAMQRPNGCGCERAPSGYLGSDPSSGICMLCDAGQRAISLWAPAFQPRKWRQLPISLTFQLHCEISLWRKTYMSTRFCKLKEMQRRVSLLFKKLHWFCSEWVQGQHTAQWEGPCQAPPRDPHSAS